ncbi:MAG: SpoIIE family protein phosphatase [Planctomycetota bacterium]
MRVLIAEDEMITRRTIERNLSAWGHTVCAVGDGQAAIEEYASGEYDLVISDWDMPRLTGIELVERIRAFRDRPFVYVMMLTGRDDEADIVAGLEAGADDYLAKPFRRDELRARVHAGERVIRVERSLSDHIQELRASQERIKNDLDAAAKLQQGVLPAADLGHDAVTTAWRYVPCDELGGDALGMTIVGGRYLIAYLLDVSGHGVPASLLSYSASLAANEATAHLKPDAVIDPAAVAQSMNERFVFETMGGRFFTMFYSVTDLASGVMTFVSAGHPPPFRCNDGTVREVADTPCLPIGVLAEETYTSGRIELEPGDRVFVFSDGLIEQPGDDGMFGLERLGTAFGAASEHPLGDAIDQTVQHLQTWSGRPLEDDISIAAIEWQGPSRA